MSPLDALQVTLAAEHAAVHVLATLGGMTSASAHPDLHALLTEQHGVHRGRREQLFVMIRNAGGDPVPADPAYALPDAENASEIREAGASTERACAQTYAAMVASTVAEQRDWAVIALGDSALTLLSWGQGAEAFPGAADLGTA